MKKRIIRKLVALLTSMSLLGGDMLGAFAQETTVSAEESVITDDASDSGQTDTVQEDAAGIISTDEQFAYVVNEEGNAVIVKYLASGNPTVTVPATLSGHPVTEIGAEAFQYNTDIETLVLAPSVKVIGEYAFDESLIKKVIMSGVETIGIFAFSEDTELEEILIPEGVKVLDTGVFKDCTGLKRVYLPKSLTTIEERAFEGCTLTHKYYAGTDYAGSVTQKNNNGNLDSLEDFPHSMAYYGGFLYEYDEVTGEAEILKYYHDGSDEVNIPATVNGYKVNVLGTDSFSGIQNISVITVPEGVTLIKNNCFKENGASVINLPSSLTDIGDYAFMQSGISGLVVPDRVTYIGQGAFEQCPYLESAVIPASVTTMEDEVFAGSYSLKSVKLKANIKRLPDYTFAECAYLESVELPDNLEVIGDSFGACISLKSVSFPAALTEIEDYAFENCIALDRLVLPETLKNIGERAFCNNQNLANVYIPKSVTSIGEQCFRGDDYLAEIYYGGTAAEWDAIAKGANAFAAEVYVNMEKTAAELPTAPAVVRPEFEYSYSGATAAVAKYNGKSVEVTVPEKVTKEGKEYTVTGIGESAFALCMSIKSITLPESVAAIADNAFMSCSGLESVNLPEALTEIGESAFSECVSLKEIIIPEKVKTIGSKAFVDCTAVNKIQLKGKPDSIGGMAFSGLHSLSSFAWPDSVAELPSGIFSNCHELTEISIPEGITKISFSAFKNCEKLKNIDLPSTLETIDKEAFSGCSSLRTLDIPDNVSTITQLAFYGCKSLMYVYYPAAANKVSINVFENCSNLAVVYFRGELTVVSNNAFKGCSRLEEVFYSVASAPTVGEGNNYFQLATKHDPGYVETTKFYECLRYKAEASGEITIINYYGTVGEVVIPDEIDGKKVTKLTDGIFRDNQNIKNIIIGKNVTEGINFDFSAVEKVVINAQIEEIPEIAFCDCHRLKEIVLPDTLKKIGENAFNGCYNLRNIGIPEAVDTIADGAFSGCSSLGNIELPVELTEIGENVFNRCVSLENITVPDGVSVIDYFAFADCDSLSTVILPATLTGAGIREGAFDGCTALKKVYYRGTEKADITSAKNDAIKEAEWICAYKGADKAEFTDDEIVLSMGEKTDVSLKLTPADAVIGNISCKMLNGDIVKLTPDTEDNKKINIEGVKSGIERIAVAADGAVAYAYVYVRCETPKANWDGTTYLTGLEPGASYEIDGKRRGKQLNLDYVADAEGRLRICYEIMGVDALLVDNWFENDHTLVRIYSENEKLNSLPQTITIGAKGEAYDPDAPEPDPEAAGVTISENLAIRIGEELTLNADVQPENAKDKTLKWESSNEKAVTVDENGKIKGIWHGSAKITVTTVNGISAVCEVTVQKKFVGDTDERARFSEGDIDDYVLTERIGKKLPPAKPVKIGDNSYAVKASVSYNNATVYTGKAIKAQDVLDITYDLSELMAAAGVTGKDQSKLFKMTFVNKKNTKASHDAYFYVKLGLAKKAKKELGLTNDQVKALKKLIKAENAVMKKNPCTYTINKASFIDLNEVKLHAKLTKDGKLKVNTKGKINGLKSVKQKFKADDKKPKKITAKSGYTYVVTNADTCRVKITGNTNFTGWITVTAEK